MKFPLQKLRVHLAVLLLAVVAVTGCNKSSDDSGDLVIPVVYTNPIIANLTPTSAESSAYLTNFISGGISGYGACWSSTNKTPTIADSKNTLTTANILRYSSDLTGLTANTLYYVRAYATTTAGTTVYGSVVQFTTPTTTFSMSATTTAYAGNGAAAYTEGALRTAAFNSPQGIVFDAAGNMYVADSFNNSVRKISTGGVVSTLAGNGTAGYAEGTGTAARLYSPQQLAVDAAGNVYVSDVGNNAIRKITPAGVVTTLAGGTGAGYVDGTGAAAKFNSPAGIVVDAAGNVYVADRGNNMIRKITAAGVVTTLSGNRAPTLNDGINTDTRFNNPIGIILDAAGTSLYVTDASNSALRKILIADGSSSTVIGDYLNAGLKTLLNQPVAITLDKTGNIFIADQTGRILEITKANILFSIAGTANTYGYAEGVGAAAQFNVPQGITTDAAGNVYVSDYNNNIIRKLVVTTKP